MSLSRVSLQSSNLYSEDGAPPTSACDLASKLKKRIDASDFSSAVNLLIFFLGQVDLCLEKETIFEYLFILLPHHDHEQYTQLCDRLPRLLEVVRDDPNKQSQLALHLSERFVTLTRDLPLAQKIEYFISAQHFIAKAVKIETISLNPSSLTRCHQIASKNFVKLVWEFLIKDRAFYTMIDHARRTTQADLLKAHMRQLINLQRLCCDEEDHKMLQTLYEQAIGVANTRNDELQECFASVFDLVDQSFSFSTPFSTERYQKALEAFRRQFDLLDSASDIRMAQEQHFETFRSFFKVLIDDILAIIGPPPCGFDLRAMGSIGRKEICPFSDLECMILIAEDTPQIRKHFILFVQILELQMASFGETPGALPFAFTCLHPPEIKGLYLDLSPRKDDRLIATPSKMAILQKELSLEGPISIQHTVLRTSSLYSTDQTLYDTYLEESQRVIDACPEDPLQQRALQHFDIRHQDFQKIWQTPFTSTKGKIELKTQFMEPLFHLLGDLALYDHVKQTNTLEIIDALEDRFNSISVMLLKEAVNFLFRLRVDIQRCYSQQRGDIYFPPVQTNERVFVAEASVFDSLEKIFYLVLFPLYHIPNLRAIRSVDLVDVAITQVIADPSFLQNPKLLVSFIRQVALFLEKIHALAERHERYYHQIGTIQQGELLQKTYIDNLADLTLKVLLAKRSTPSGCRQEKRLREESLFASLSAITSTHFVEGLQVQVSAPCFQSPRYLLPSVARQIIDNQGKIISNYESKHRVTSLVWQEHRLHFKMWPSHPLMEYALFDLYYRITGQLSPANTLVRFTVIQDGKPYHYPVLISATLDYPTLSKKASAGDIFSNIDVKQWSWLIICAILTRTGDGRLSNYVMSDLGKIYAVDNDIAFVFPTQESVLFSKINFACVLFSLSQNPPPLDPEVLQEFLSLDFDLILSSWLEEIIEKEKIYNSLFHPEGKPVFLEVPPKDLRNPEKDFFTSSILFSPGAIVSCRLQAARLKSAILRIQESNTHVFCFDLLKELISLRTDLPLERRVGERVFRAYVEALKQTTVAARYAAAIGRKAPSSLTLAEFQRASFEHSPSQKEIEEATYSPREALHELLTVIQQADDRVRYTTQASGAAVLHGDFAHLRSAEGPQFLRQELVLKYLSHIAESGEVKPICVTLRDCDILSRSNLLPFLHRELKIIDLRNSPQILSRSLIDIANQCPQLEELYLCRANIGAFPPSVSFFTAEFPKLRLLQITECPRFTSLQIVAPQLEYLDLSSNPQLKTLRLMVDSFPVILLHNSFLTQFFPGKDLSEMIGTEKALKNALAFYKQFYQHLSQSKPTEILTYTTYNLGWLLEKNQEYVEAKKYYLEFYKMLKRHGTTLGHERIKGVKSLIAICEKLQQKEEVTRYQQKLQKYLSDSRYGSLIADNF